MYQPYPGSAEMPVVARQPLPPSMRTAIRAMYAGAASSVFGIVVDVLTVGSTKNAIARHSPNLTASQLNSSEHALVAGFIVSGVIGVGVWLFLARTCHAGKPWARIVATVLFGLATVDTIVGITVPLATAVKGYAAVVWLIGLVAVVFLWRRTSSAYFAGAPR
jgi:hypothetical protein